MHFRCWCFGLQLLAMETFPELPRAVVSAALRRSSGLQPDRGEAIGWSKTDAQLLAAYTPYGPVMKRLKVPHRLQGDVEVEFADPRALLWLEMKVSPAYSAFLQQTLPNWTSEIVVYSDDVRPGNVQRPDSGRLYYAYYWAILEMPSWWRSGPWGWYDLTFVLANDEKEILGGLLGMCMSASEFPALPKGWTRIDVHTHSIRGLGALTDRLFEVMNFPIVVDPPVLHIPARLRPAGFELNFLVFLADEKANKSCLGLKGSSSYRPCGCCVNCVGRMSEDVVHHPFVHHTCPDADQWDLWTFERFQVACNEVREAWDDSEDSGQRKEMELGIVFENGLNVNFTPRAPVLRVPECILWDAQHSIWASGGVAQYEGNQLMHETKSAGVRWPLIDSFVRQTRHPGGTRFRRSLSERVTSGVDKHMRAFAGEMICVVAALTLVCDMILTPAAVLPAHATCMRMLFTTQFIALMGDSGLPHMQLLDELLEAHQVLFLALYPSCAKPKLHYVRHLARMWRRFGKVLTCFSAERHHRTSERIGAFVYRHLTKTCMSRS